MTSNPIDLIPNPDDLSFNADDYSFHSDDFSEDPQYITPAAEARKIYHILQQRY